MGSSCLCYDSRRVCRLSVCRLSTTFCGRSRERRRVETKGRSKDIGGQSRRVELNDDSRNER